MKIKIADSHTDFLTAMKDTTEREKYIAQCAKCGVSTISCAVFTTESEFSVDDIKCFNDEIKMLAEKYNIQLLLSIEDLGFIHTKEDLLKLIGLKPFSVTLTWNEVNQYAGGANCKEGLTQLGVKTITLLEQNGIVVDTAHMSKLAFDEFASITTLPIFNSHSNISSLCQHQRNLTDQQIDKIVQSNGYLGLTIYDKFIADCKVNSEAVAKQFDYLIKIWKDANFGFGTDLYGIDFNHLPIDINGYIDLHKVAEALRKMGHRESAINGIMNNNFERFVNKIKAKIHQNKGDAN